MFGIQWDLVLKYLNENSETWENYYNLAYNLPQTIAHGYKGTLVNVCNEY